MRMRVKIEGLRELEAQLDRLQDRTAKAALVRAGKKAGQPMADLMSQLAPRDTGELEDSALVSTRLSRRQAAAHRKMVRGDKSSAEVFIGMGPKTGIIQEWGTFNQPPQPFARPAWDQDRAGLLRRVGEALKAEIMAAVGRATRAGKLRN